MIFVIKSSSKSYSSFLINNKLIRDIYITKNEFYIKILIYFKVDCVYLCSAFPGIQNNQHPTSEDFPCTQVLNLKLHQIEDIFRQNGKVFKIGRECFVFNTENELNL
jgi:hypothetical protein